MEQILNLLKLTLHPEKTQIVNFERGFSFLGHGFLENAIFPTDLSKSQSQSIMGKSAENSVKTNLPSGSKSANQKQPIKSVEDSESIALQAVNNKKFFESKSRNKWSKELATIYLFEYKTIIYQEHQCFVIKVNNDKIEVPIRELERIFIFGNIQVPSSIVTTCLEEEIIILFINQTGQYKGDIRSNYSGVFHELVQFERRKDENFKFRVSQAIVRGKLMNSKQLLLKLNRKRQIPDIAKAITGITSDIAAVDSVNNIDTLRGYEGIGAARYFPAFGKLIANDAFNFSQRYRHPPTDPVNSLLSFGYTLLCNNVVSLIAAEGLYPSIGNLHYGEEKKKYLAFDLMEEFRSPIVDSLVLIIINNALLKTTDFELDKSNEGIYLTSSARRFFTEQFEERMNEEVSHPDVQSTVCYRQVIHLQIRRYKRSLLSLVPYEPFLRIV